MPDSPPASAPLKVASYNVHGCLGADRRYRPERIAAVIRETGASVVGLQEVDTRVSHGTTQLELLARETGMEPIAGPAYRVPFGYYGNVLLTRYPVHAVRLLDLSVDGREPRAALDADVALPEGKLRVVVTHFGLRSAERRVQFAQLLLLVDSNGDRPLVVMGDFNEWLPLRHPLRLMNRRLGPPHRAPFTFPAWLPVLALDRIWAAPREALGELRAHLTPTARIASDHLPVVATIDLAARGR